MTRARDLASTALNNTVSTTELGYLDGVTSSVQTQLDAKAPSSTAVTLTGTQTLTNKTLTNPVIASVVNNTLTTAKGDLVTATAASTPARLAVGNDGEQIVADSSTSTGLRYQSGYNGNAIINGGMDIWQRGVTFTNPTAAGYTADRYMINRTGDVAGATVSRSTSTTTGFQYAMQWQRTAANTGVQDMNIYYGLESSDSYRFAGQTATLSFYAKKGANYSGGNLNYLIASSTGTDGKPYSYTTTVASTSATLTTSYQRFSVTGTFASNITQAFFNVSWVPSGTAGADDSVFITGIQLELGSVATSFKRAGGTLQGELAACQRYYWRSTGSTGYSVLAPSGYTQGTGNCPTYVTLPVQMRVAPTSVEYSNIQILDMATTAYTVNAFTIGDGNSPNIGCANAAATTNFTTGRFAFVRQNNNSAGYIAYSAELQI